MAKLDQQLTQKIQDWLNTPADQRDITAGATMMLSINRNRALFNTILRQPVKFAEKLEYELRKFLKIRLAGMAISDVVNMEKEVMPVVEETIKVQPVLSTDDEIPEGNVAKGKRSDHDSLPEEIQALWDDNFTRYKQIVLLFNELKAMSNEHPCDRYEKLKLLDNADKAYRAALEQYDNYVIPEQTEPVEQPEAEEQITNEGSNEAEVEAEPDDESAKAINAARKTISKYKKRLLTDEVSEEERTTALEKIQSAVNTVIANGGSFTDATKNELEALGIDFTPIVNNAEA